MRVGSGGGCYCRTAWHDYDFQAGYPEDSSHGMVRSNAWPTQRSGLFVVGCEAEFKRLIRLVAKGHKHLVSDVLLYVIQIAQRLKPAGWRRTS